MKKLISISLLLILSTISNSQVLWGTYHGSGSETIYRSAYDKINNVIYVAVRQSTGSSWAKFSTSGALLLSGTFGTGTGIVPHGICVDNSGNFFIMGTVGASSGGIATVGAHQTTYGGGNTDNFLVKYNSSGVKQWSTYYGGSGDESVWGGVVADNMGNVYLTGTSSSSSSIALAGFQPTLSGMEDGYLVKFNSNGVRQWGTYYGGTADELVTDICIDGSNNLYICGYSGSPTNISTAGAHQFTSTAQVPFFAKFDNSGNRLWGTYYGGTTTGQARSIKCDQNNNVYVCGYTDGTGAYFYNSGYQNAFGGNRDGFVAKFNSLGTVQWGTYVGALGLEQCMGIEIDINDNVFVSGMTNSNTGLAVAATQSVYGGGTYDAFLAKISPNGSTLNYLTYKGGSALDQALDVEIDNANKVYIAGLTQSANNIAFNGYDNALTGSQNSFLVKYDNTCLAPNQPSLIAGLNSFCAVNNLQTYSVTSTSWASSYSWSLPGGWTGTSTTNVISTTAGLSGGAISVMAVNACGASSAQVLTVTVNPNPTITAISSASLLCVGQNATLTASGASSYTWNPGGAATSIVVSPTATATYTVLGVDANGCQNSTSFTQNVSACTGLDPVAEAVQVAIEVYPNPFNNKITIVTSGEVESPLQLFNALGSLIHSQSIKGKTEIDLIEQPSGIYFVKVGTEIRKLVKQ